MNRAEEILRFLVNDKSLVKGHNDWGYYIQVPFDEINMIGLIDKGDRYELSLYYGDTQSQSRAFYNINPKIERLSKDWLVHPNFHFSSSFGKGLIWFKSDVNAQEYINFWKKNGELLHQYSIADAKLLIDRFTANGIIQLNENKRSELNNAIFSKNYSVLNISAGLGVIYKIPKSQIENDSLSELKDLLVSKISEGLSVINENGNEFLIDGDPIGF